MKLWKQVALILSAAFLAGGVSAVVHPYGPPWFESEDPSLTRWRIDLSEARALMEKGPVIWIDARPRKAHETAAIPGSLLLNPEEWGDLMFEHQMALQEAFDRPVVVYCDGEDCSRSSDIAGRLRELLGLDPVYVLEGDWRELGIVE